MIKLLQAIIRLPSYVLILCVRVYQICLSRFVGNCCRFNPSCSHYFIGAVEKYGAILGTFKGIWRICRCNPWNPGGEDPP